MERAEQGPRADYVRGFRALVRDNAPSKDTRTSRHAAALIVDVRRSEAKLVRLRVCGGARSDPIQEERELQSRGGGWVKGVEERRGEEGAGRRNGWGVSGGGRYGSRTVGGG